MSVTKELGKYILQYLFGCGLEFLVQLPFSEIVCSTSGSVAMFHAPGYRKLIQNTTQSE